MCWKGGFLTTRTQGTPARKVKLKKLKKSLTKCHNMGIINSAAANQDKQSGQGVADKLNNGLSPNGKATDSDSVISRFESL